MTLDTTFGGCEMKAVFATVILSIFSAAVGVLSVTELCAKSNATRGTSDTIRENTSEPRPPRQKMQQWVNH